MVQIWRSFSYAVPAFAAVAAMAVLVASLVGLRRRRNRPEPIASGPRELVLDTLVVLWLVGLGLVTLDPGRVPVPRGSVELVPFRGILQLVTNALWWQVPAAQIGGNVLLFVTGGLLLAWRRPWSLGRTVLVGGLISVAIETLQYVLALGVASIDDVLLACVGTLLGAAAARLARSRVEPTAAEHGATREHSESSEAPISQVTREQRAVTGRAWPDGVGLSPASCESDATEDECGYACQSQGCERHEDQ